MKTYLENPLLFTYKIFISWKVTWLFSKYTNKDFSGRAERGVFFIHELVDFKKRET